MTRTINIKPKAECRWDFVSLGEVMLRFDPGDAPLRAARQFAVCEGGGEYNVARALASCFRLDAAVVTALVDNELGRLTENLIAAGRVDGSQILWREFDGVGRAARNGIYFWERGFGARPPAGCSDRGHTAISQLKPGDVDWRLIFEQSGARWFHTGGVFAGLSDSAAEVAAEAMRAARDAGAIVSFDLNYRHSLWKTRGGRAVADQLNFELAKYADVMFGVLKIDYNEETKSLIGLDAGNLLRQISTNFAQFPCLKLVAATLRQTHTATRHDWRAVCSDGTALVESKRYDSLEIFDRVGGGDAFAAGFIYGLIKDLGTQTAIDCGAAAGALAMTTPGDSLLASSGQVEELMRGTSGAAR